jgi:hypothetical protein
MEPTLLRSISGTVARWALNGVMGALTARGVIKGADAEELIVYAGIGLAALAWGIWVKYREVILRFVALRMQAGSTEAELKAEAKDIKTLKDLKALSMILILFSVLGLSACGGEESNKKLETAVRSIYIGLQTASESIEVLNNGNRISNDGALKAYGSLNQIGVGTKQFKEAVRAYGEITPENKRDLIEKLDLIIAQIERARQNDLIGLTREEVARVEIHYEAIKSGYLTIKGIVAAIKKPVKVSEIPALAQ